MVKMERLRQLIGLSRLQANWATRWPVDLAGDRAVLIYGSGRSGTSWLANICNANNQFRYVFEPLKPDLWPIPEDTISWSCDATKLNNYLIQVVNGEVSNHWVNSRNRRVFARQRLIKDIRGGLLLNALQQRFPALQVIHILRNPLAVAASRKSLSELNDGSSWEWQPSLSQQLEQSAVAALLSEVELRQLSGLLGKGIVLETVADWCLNNLVAMRQSELGAKYIVYYENLVQAPENSAQKLFEFLQLDYDDQVANATRRRSETSRNPDLSRITDAQQLQNTTERWRSVLTQEEQRLSLELLNSFGIQSLYTKDWAPVTNLQRGES